jgi:uncharacterized membrane protein
MLTDLFTKTPLFFFIQSFWRDEGFTYLMAKLPILEILKTTAKDFNPPVYYILMHYWMMIFGSSEVSMRSVSLIFFAVNIYFFYLFCKNILKIKSKIIWGYTFLFAINPFLVYYAFEARMYSMFALLTTLSMYFFLQKKWGKYLIFSILGIYTHYFFIFVLASQFIYMINCHCEERRDAAIPLRSVLRRGWFDRLTTRFFATLRMTDEKGRMIKNFFIIGLTFLPWFIYIFPTITSKTENFWMGKLNLYQVFESIGILFTGYENVYGFYDRDISMLSLILAIVIFFGLWFRQKTSEQMHEVHFSSRSSLEDKGIFFLLFLWGFIFYFLIVVIGIFKPIFTPRYLIFSAVGFVFLITYLLEKMPKILRFLILIVLILYSLSYNNLQALHKRKGDIRSTVNKIKVEIKKGDLIYVRNETMYFMLSYYFPEEGVYVYGKNYEEIPYYVGLALLPKAKITQSLPLYPHKAFILIDDYNYIVQSRL